MDDFDHELSRFDAGENVLSECLLLHRVGELLGNLEVHVGIKEGASHVFECFGDVDFCDFSFALQQFEGAFKSLAKIFKHILEKGLKGQKWLAL